MGAPTGTLQRLCLVLSVSLGLLGLVGGCSDPDQPSTLPSDTPTPTSLSASPTPSTPEQEVAATMQAYFEAANVMFMTGNVEPIRAFSTSGCSCRAITNSVARVAQRGGRYEGARYVVESIRVHDLDTGSAVAEVKAQVPPYKVIDSEGKITEDSDGGILHTDFSLVRREDRWVIGNAFNLE